MHWPLIPRNKPALFWAVLDAFPEAAHVSLEGDLKQFRLLERSDASTAETLVLRRNTLSPRLDFVVLPVSPELVSTLKQIMSGAGIFNDGGLLIHAQVEFRGKLVLGAYDNFHEDCVVACEPLGEDFLEPLRTKGILRSYEAIS